MAAGTMMRAARFYGQKDIRIDDVPIPQVGPNQVLIEVEWCGICGSDLHEYVTGKYYKPGPTSDMPLLLAFGDACYVD